MKFLTLSFLLILGLKASVNSLALRPELEELEDLNKRLDRMTSEFIEKRSTVRLLNSLCYHGIICSKHKRLVRLENTPYENKRSGAPMDTYLMCQNGFCDCEGFNCDAYEGWNSKRRRKRSLRKMLSAS